MSSSLPPAFPLTTWHPCTSLLLEKMASLKFGGYPFCIQPSQRFCFECIFVWKYAKSAKTSILFGWGMRGRAGGVHVVSKRKLEVALSDLLKACLQPVNARGLLKEVIWKGAALSRFTLPATFHVTETPWLCIAAKFVLSFCSFCYCFSADLLH